MSTLTPSAAPATWLTPFTPRAFLRNGHLQTLAGNFLRRNVSLPEPERLLVEVEGPVANYGPSYVLCQCHWQPEEVRAQRLTVVLLHGLEGSSNSKYMIGNTARALAAGFNVVRMNMRSCGGTDEICPTIYHSGRSGDVAAVVRKDCRNAEAGIDSARRLLDGRESYFQVCRRDRFVASSAVEGTGWRFCSDGPCRVFGRSA